MFQLFGKEKAVKIRFVLDKEQINKRMTWDDLDTIEMSREGETSPRRLKALAARFMADDKGEYLPTEKALKILGALPVDEINDVLKQFMEAFTGQTLPPPSGTGSSLPSAVGQAETFPPGSVS